MRFQQTQAGGIRSTHFTRYVDQLLQDTGWMFGHGGRKLQ
jgi:hypothetical protein